MRSFSVSLLPFAGVGCGLLFAGCSADQLPAKPDANVSAPNLGDPAASSTEPTPVSVRPVENSQMLQVHEEPCGESPDGQKISQFVMSNRNGMRVKVLNWGGIITTVEAPDRRDKSANVTLGFSDLNSYFQNAPYFGGICGRYANRISGAKFTLDGQEYPLFANIPPNALHGGKESFIKKVWQARTVEKPEVVGVELTYVSPDGEEGYPGTLTTTVTYSLNDDNELGIEYEATTDKPTVLNLTNHAYWNLSGVGTPSALDHVLTLMSDEYVDIDENAIPTGKFTPVAGTCMDFTNPEKIGARIDQTVNGGGGYDHCYVVRGGGKGKLVPVAKVFDPDSGRVMEVLSTEPGVQLYTGNFLKGTPETGNAQKQGAFCLETQHFPDSPNRPEFPSTVLRPGETYRQTTIHRFSVEK
jgi:aldose 1-epimerase